jgi:thiosulfate/3-mercaptopyruvate sulfurtransferase
MVNVWITAKDIEQKDVRFVDTRFSLQDTKAGRNLYNSGHLKNAIYMDLELDLSDMTISEGRHPLPTKKDMQSLFEANGFHYSDQIIIYDQGGMPFAPRAYWMFKYAGFPNVFILRESYEQLVENGFEISIEKPVLNKTTLHLHWDENMLSVRDTVKMISDGIKAGVLLDARSAERYSGSIEPIDPIAGHIPSARNFDWEQLKQDGLFMTNTDVREKLLQVVSKEEEITVYCGSGVTAAPLYAMLKEVGFPNVKLYVGSYSDWITTYPVEK